MRARIVAGESRVDIFGLRQGGAVPRGPAPRPETFFTMADLGAGIARSPAPGITTAVFPGVQAMLSVVSVAPNSRGSVHSHPEDQGGVPLEGSGTRVQDGV
ncbi:MAG: hypothetical protein AAF677_06075 [Pseudomonadota bacterium]